MSLSCEQHAEDLVPYIRGEVAPLVKTRLESHLQRCRPCQRLQQQMQAALAGATNLEPELEAAQLDRKITRLGPYIEASRAGQNQKRRVPVAWLAVSTATAAALLVVALYFLGNTNQNSVATPAAAIAEIELEDNNSFELDTAPARHQPTPHIRMLAATLWDGDIETRGRRAVVRMSRGFAAISFVSGQGRRLLVQTPTASVEVVGTRFLVDVDDAGAVTVAVAQGKVLVRNSRAPSKPQVLHAGKALVTTSDGWANATKLPASTRYLDDPYLIEHHDQPHPTARPHPNNRPTHKTVMDPQVADVLEQLERAEQLVTRDQSAAAVTIFESCIDDEDPVYDPYRDLCRLQLGRLLAFERGQKQQARALLELLAGSPSDVGSEASLALCELELDSDPCHARTCLTKLTLLPNEPQLAREAKSLLVRWRLGREVCEQP